jgi:hypothetical protein
MEFAVRYGEASSSVCCNGDGDGDLDFISIRFLGDSDILLDFLLRTCSHSQK